MQEKESATVTYRSLTNLNKTRKSALRDDSLHQMPYEKRVIFPSPTYADSGLQNSRTQPNRLP